MRGTIGTIRVAAMALLVAAAPAARLAETRPAAVTLPADLAAKVDAAFAGWKADSPGCAIGISQDGREVFSRAYGAADLEQGIPNTPETVFEAGSVSKQFTAAAILLLAQSDKLKLDDEVREYLPELPDYGTPVTLRHLLHHTSGLRDWGTLVVATGWPRGTRVYTHAYALDIMSRQKALNFPPGSEYLYNTGAYNLLVLVVERVSGKSFAQYTHDMIFAPLGMDHTQWRDDYTHLVKGRAQAYEKKTDGYHLDMPFEDVVGNGGLLTTVGDLLRWNRNFTSERVGGKALVTELQRRGRLNDGLEISYARGLEVGRFRGVPEVRHTGATAGYRSFLTRFPDQGVSIAVLCNAAEAKPWTAAHEVAVAALGDALGPVPEPSPVPVDAAVLARWAGLYRNVRTAEPVRVSLDKGALSVEGRGPLVPQSDALFAVGDGAVRARFKGDGVGRSFDVIGEDGDVTHYAIAAEVKPTAEELARYEGTYVSDEADATYAIRVENGTLYALRRPDARFALKPAYHDAFTNDTLPLVLFRRDERGQLTGLSLGLGRVRDLRFRRLPAGDASPAAAP